MGTGTADQVVGLAEQQPVILVDTGGTFNKRYRPRDGSLVVEPGAQAAREILRSAERNLDIDWLQPVCKDSLEMTDVDRETIVASLCEAVARRPDAPIVVVHGTDTMARTGEVLARAFPGHCVVLTGAMRPYEIDPVEPALNLGLALGFVQGAPAPGVYLAMSGLVRRLGELEKDRAAARFRPIAPAGG
ncbi:asparaginase domain-containing protein [Guyparkeria hydrothermalis]|uniref:asparaginase domain-containing protein n=1 Tax=Guyparkeria TaxID=2035712 RepID=UPI0010AB66CE|nr:MULTISPECIES: asparaginase domain-containing protein [Guyparkeria]MCL7751812.1 asparaginase domain-containing protein [Guyparkeria hydrothermalis]TKA89329.1 asparaginase [Guyparkeria sp. SB14A]